ncbi:MAG: tol-pal system protein YbgF [Pseudomonadota bacterium]
MRIFITVLFAAILAGPLAAQSRDQTLADIRQELSVLLVEMQTLKRELNTTTGPGIRIGGGTLERVDAIEAELRRLTRKTEELEARIDRVVRDGTNRIGDLEFRLVELEGGDVGKLAETTTLGGDVTGAAPASLAALPPGGAELAVGEQADYDRAIDALNMRDFADAARQFATFLETYPGSPLTGEVHFHRGEALTGQAQWKRAAHAYLESFSGAPDGSAAPRALLRLGESLGRLGQQSEACITLGEVAVRFPDTPEVTAAQSAIRSLNCP